MDQIVPRMRTAPKIVAEIKALDPDSEVTEYYIRNLVKSGAVPVVWAGNKALINLDAVIELLRQGTSRPQAEVPTCRGIRKVDVKNPK
ncbi:MAG: hypothetical protein HFF84_13375 [Oscillibacter sp.]|nr:hypothetical protein [Oscillibacter sp.]